VPEKRNASLPVTGGASKPTALFQIGPVTLPFYYIDEQLAHTLPTGEGGIGEGAVGEEGEWAEQREW